MSATILCVQESRSSSDRYAQILEMRGYEPLPVHDGGQAMEVLREQHADLVLLDVSLSHQDGFQVLSQLRALPNADPLPVMMLFDGEVTSDLEERARSLGAAGVIPASMRSEELMDRVAEFVKPSLTPSACGRMLPDEGRLNEIPFPELLHELHQLKFVGALLLKHGRKRKAIEFRDGWPICVKSNLLSECLGKYLVETGRCSAGAVDESFARMKQGQGQQGEILVAMDVLDEEGVVEALEGHAFNKLFEIFSWQGGQFELRAGGEVQRGTSIALHGHPSNLICAGVRGHTPNKLIDALFKKHAEKYLVPSLGAEGAYQAVDLDPDEANWFAGLDGTLPVASLLNESEARRRLAFGLISVELLSIEASPGSAEDASRLQDTRAHEVYRGSAAKRGDEESLRQTLAQMANRMVDLDHYGVLELTSPVADEQVERAYRSLSAQAHPDLFLGASSSVRQLANQVFTRVEEAYQALRTAEAREEYEGERHQDNRPPVVEEEGRRALRAETEFQKGEALLVERDYESALVHFGRAMESFPAAGEYRSYYGWCLYLCHQDSTVMLEEALEHCREGLKLAKDREKSYLLLGRLYKVMGKTGAAKKMFTRAVQIKPQSVDAMRELRIMNMRRGKDKGVFKRLFRR